MDFDVLDSLDDLGNSVSSMNITEKEQRQSLMNEENFACLRYTGFTGGDDAIVDAIKKGAKSVEFTKIVEWLSKELQVICDLESCVNALTDPDDSSSFLLEVSSFLKELNCPYKSLTTGPISQRLLDVDSRTVLLDFLCTELQAARLLQSKKTMDCPLEIEMQDSSIALSIGEAMKTLNIKADISDDPSLAFSEIDNKVKEMLPSSPVDPPALDVVLSEEQWKSIQELYNDFMDEYTVRREMLLTRLDVTVQSFKWGEGIKGKENKILEKYLPRRKKLNKIPSVKLQDVLAARKSLFIVEKTSSAELVKNTKSSVNRVLIPAVPDRGGRPKEQRPPVEMPSWMKRSSAGGGTGDHRGGRGNRGKKFKGGGGWNKKRCFDAAGSY